MKTEYSGKKLWQTVAILFFVFYISIKNGITIDTFILALSLDILIILLIIIMNLRDFYYLSSGRKHAFLVPYIDDKNFHHHGNYVSTKDIRTRFKRHSILDTISFFVLTIPFFIPVFIFFPFWISGFFYLSFMVFMCYYIYGYYHKLTYLQYIILTENPRRYYEKDGIIFFY